MWKRIFYTVASWLLVVNLWLYVAVTRRKPDSRRVRHLAKRIRQLSLSLPRGKGAEILADCLTVSPSRLDAPLFFLSQDILVENKDALRSSAMALARVGEYELAEALLWRGIRLYEADKEMWDSALYCTLTDLLYRTSPNERLRLYHRLVYLLAQIPEDIRRQPSIAAYFIFQEKVGTDLLKAQHAAVCAWGEERITDVRRIVPIVWQVARAYSPLPDPFVAWAAWAMLGVGLFDMLVQDSLIKQLYPEWVQVAEWFLGAPLPSASARHHRDALLALLQCVQDFQQRRCTIAELWHTFLAARTPTEKMIASAMFSATILLGRDKQQRRIEHWLNRVGERMALPYAHMLCVLAVRLRWEPLTQELWRLINLFSVEYPRKTELYYYMENMFGKKFS
jgi:hypothetical protein